VEAHPRSPVSISSDGKEIRLRRIAELLAMCNLEDAINLQVALQRVINTHFEWKQDYAQQEAEMERER